MNVNGITKVFLDKKAQKEVVIDFIHKEMGYRRDYSIRGKYVMDYDPADGYYKVRKATKKDRAIAEFLKYFNKEED